MEDYNNSSTLAMGLLQSDTKQSKLRFCAK